MSKANTPHRERSPVQRTEAESDAEQCEDTTRVSQPNNNE